MRSVRASILLLVMFAGRQLPGALLILVLIVLARTPVFAVEVVSPAGSSCEPPVGLVWREEVIRSVVTPALGGLLQNPTRLVSLSVPPLASFVPLTITFSSTLTSTVPSSITTRGLGFFTFKATDGTGDEHARLLSPWTFSLDYGECPLNEPCNMDMIDEASLRCMRLNDEDAAWQPVRSWTNVFANRVTCQSSEFGHFAVVADLLETSGELGQSTIYLPVLHR